MDQQAVSANASLIPAAMDFLLVVPRLAHKAGSYAFFHMPGAMDNIAGKIFNGGSMIADATGQQTANSTITNTSHKFVQSTAAAAGMLDAAFREGGGEEMARAGSSSSMFGMMVHGLARLKNFGGIFSYLTSRWALATFTAVCFTDKEICISRKADLTSMYRPSSSIEHSSTLHLASIYAYDGICGSLYT